MVSVQDTPGVCRTNTCALAFLPNGGSAILGKAVAKTLEGRKKNAIFWKGQLCHLLCISLLL